MTNSTNNMSANVSMDSQKFEKATNFKYLGATLCKDAPVQQKFASGLPRRWQLWPA